jgi:hypothetical protein
VIRILELVLNSFLLLVAGLQVLILLICLVVSCPTKSLIGWRFFGQSGSTSMIQTFAQPEEVALPQFESVHSLEVQAVEPLVVSQSASRAAVVWMVDRGRHWLLALQLSLAPLPLWAYHASSLMAAQDSTVD